MAGFGRLKSDKISGLKNLQPEVSVYITDNPTYIVVAMIGDNRMMFRTSSSIDEAVNNVRTALLDITGKALNK